jgi:hypothetical protein
MVAMFGASMPQPLAIPPTVQPSPRTSDSLGRVSVVRMPLAASLWPSRLKASPSLVMPPRIFRIGSWKPMRPVEQTSISWAEQPTASAAASHIVSALARPLAPVPALALPELTMTPDAMPFDAVSRSTQASTGGARNLLVVKTAAVGTGLPSSVTSKATSRRLAFSPAWTPAATKPSAAVTLMDTLRQWEARPFRRDRA